MTKRKAAASTARRKAAVEDVVDETVPAAALDHVSTDSIKQQQQQQQPPSKRTRRSEMMITAEEGAKVLGARTSRSRTSNRARGAVAVAPDSMSDSEPAAASSSSAASSPDTDNDNAAPSDSEDDGDSSSSRRRRGEVACSMKYEVEAGGVPVFKPSWEEFKDFAVFIERIQNVGAHYGLVKVIPPESYKPNQNGFRSVGLDKLLIQSPVRQNVRQQQGAPSGVHRVLNTDEPSRRQITAREFEGLCTDQTARRSAKEKEMVQRSDWDGLERTFWRQTLINPPLYGADSPGTLFDESCQAWNVGHLPSLLHVLPGPGTPGVSLPFLYFGMWKSLFAMHKEDVNLYSINYLHFGFPKQWYGIPPRFADKFDRLADNLYPLLRRSCSEFIRHKELLVSPQVLRESGIPYVHTRQSSGNFMLTWPTAYHQGFNYGLNCAESVNFATNKWFPFASGNKCGRCLCRGDTVWLSPMDVRSKARALQFYLKQQQQQKQEEKNQKQRSKQASDMKQDVTEHKQAINPTPSHTDDDSGGMDNSPSQPSKTAPFQVPSDYVLDESSIWLGLPTNPRELHQLAQRIFPEPELEDEDDEDEEEGEEGDESAPRRKQRSGRSMSGRSMSQRASNSNSSFLFERDEYNTFDTSSHEGSLGFRADSNAVFCSYPDCDQPLHRDQRALIIHYQKCHSASARSRNKQKSSDGQKKEKGDEAASSKKQKRKVGPDDDEVAEAKSRGIGTASSASAADQPSSSKKQKKKNGANNVK